MRDLVTYEEAAAHLRLDDRSTDPWLEAFIPAISEAVAMWIKDSDRLYEPLRDSDGDVVLDSDDEVVFAVDVDDNPIIRRIVRVAVLIEIERQNRFRGGESDADVPSFEGHGYVLGKGATALLAPLRKTTVA